MDVTKRQITKIAREVAKYTTRAMKQDGIGPAEFDYLHVIRKNPGITQARICRILTLDKGAAARRAAALEAKGYLVRRQNPQDGRSQLLYATPKAEALKNSKAWIEAHYYEWLEQELSPEEQQQFASLLNRIYQKNKAESKADFVHVQAYIREKEVEK
jgi:DNA-binding MarR family transcriptional regulator